MNLTFAEALKITQDPNEAIALALVLLSRIADALEALSVTEDE